MRLVSLLICAFLLGACHHFVMPVRSDPLPADTLTPLPGPPREIRLDNGYTERSALYLRSDGIHRVHVDLEEWTQRLLEELRDELETAGVRVQLGGATPETAHLPAVAVRVTGVEVPTESAPWVFLTARVAASDGQLAKDFSSTEEADGFPPGILRPQARDTHRRDRSPLA